MSGLRRLRRETNPTGVAFLFAILVALAPAWFGVYSGGGYWPVVVAIPAWLVFAEVLNRLYYPDQED